MAIERSKLRLSDLKERKLAGTKLMGINLPLEIASAIDRLAKELKVTKTSVVVALLNEGLAVAQKTKKG